MGDLIGVGERRTGAGRLSARFRVGAAAILVTLFTLGTGSAVPEGDRALKFYNLHTKESATIVYKRNGVYDRAGLTKVNHILRDWRKNQPINMDPKLLDLIWQVYQASGATAPISVICGYRSPATNSALRRRSRGVAQHSQHTLGKALDFYIPGVPLAKLREIGLKMQTGGVGYYPSSGSPFVHFDTGSVRMWPRMTRQQLVKVFPNGKTLYVPSDGRPLPGYAAALVAYKARRGAPAAAPAIAVASADKAEEETTVAVAAADIPLPRIAPDREDFAIAELEDGDRFAVAFEPPAPETRPQLAPIPDSFFEVAYEVETPDVPVALANAMAARDQSRRTFAASSAGPLVTTGSLDPNASLPIPPTAIVATVDVSRPLRAEAMTMAVLRGGKDVSVDSVPPLLSYAPPAESFPGKPRRASVTGMGSARPATAALKRTAAAAAPTVADVKVLIAAYRRLPSAELTLTGLDTQGLRIWIAGQSTREKRYALLTMPDFGQAPSLLDKPTVAYAAGFNKAAAYPGLRTDHFSGRLVQPPQIVDLTLLQVVAAR